ncbi:hypothetical protein [Hymenobacter lucidus]|uniref:Lipoprotein n=1 Tax=Hymenobacter lucidus TaxID=2880930 RepID=A0ABS8ATS8_9BACT|nr:hypothetical protein [Hymenobacter lucidus]MCB2409613.1 hypothetical protein [Hymenobacter lucidus]
MRNLFTGLLLLGTIGLMECSDKTKEAPKPPDPAAAANYAEIDGKPFEGDSTRINAVLLLYKPGHVNTDQKTDYLIINIPSQPKGQSIELASYDFKMKPGKIVHPVNTPDTFFDYTGISYGSFGTQPAGFRTIYCNSNDWTIDITEFDQVRKRVKGTFSGTLCSGTKTLSITKGRFNLPYQVR